MKKRDLSCVPLVEVRAREKGITSRRQIANPANSEIQDMILAISQERFLRAEEDEAKLDGDFHNKVAAF